MDVDVLDAKFFGGLQEFITFLIRELIALGIALPLGSIELDTGDLVFLDLLVEILEAFVAITRVKRTVQDEAIWMALLHRVVALGRIEAVLVEITEEGRLQNGHIVVASHEQIVVHRLCVVLLELFLGPDLILGA